MGTERLRAALPASGLYFIVEAVSYKFVYLLYNYYLLKTTGSIVLNLYSSGGGKSLWYNEVKLWQVMHRNFARGKYLNDNEHNNGNRLLLHLMLFLRVPSFLVPLI